MHTQRVVATIAAGAAVLGVFLPWARVPLFGSVTGVDVGEWAWAVLAACGVALASAVVGDPRAPIGSLARGAGIFSGLGIAAFSGWLIVEFHRASAGSLAGPGLYLLVAAGIGITFGPDLVRDRTRSRTDRPTEPSG